MKQVGGMNNKTVRTSSSPRLRLVSIHIHRTFPTPPRGKIRGQVTTKKTTAKENLTTVEGPPPSLLLYHLHWPQKPRPGGCTGVDVTWFQRLRGPPVQM